MSYLWCVEYTYNYIEIYIDISLHLEYVARMVMER